VRGVCTGKECFKGKAWAKCQITEREHSLDYDYFSLYIAADRQKKIPKWDLKIPDFFKSPQIS
jgi:hypothetical protein